MKEKMKTLVSLTLALVMCLAMVPTNTVNAATVAVDCAQMTDEQLMTAYFGEWDDSASISKDHITVEYDFDEDVMEVDTDWKFVGSVILEGLILSDDDYVAKVMDGKELKTKVKALKFKSDDAEFLIHRDFFMLNSKSMLMIEMTTADGTKSIARMFKKEAEVNGVTKSVGITELLTMAKDAVVEEPTATPEVKTDETTTDKEVVEKTKDGRAVYAGETVYVVKKGGCFCFLCGITLSFDN